MEHTKAVHELLYKYLVALKIDFQEFEKFSHTPLSTNIFILPNQAAFQFVTHFLFSKLDRAKCAENFRHLWPLLSKKHAADFNKVAFNWLSSLVQENPEAEIPKVTFIFFMSPCGEKLCSLYLAFARFVLQNSFKKRNKVHVLKMPSSSLENKTAALNVHVAMYENLILQQDNLQKISLDIHTKLAECATALANTNLEVKRNIINIESLLEEKNKEILHIFVDEGVLDAEQKLTEWNKKLLELTHNFWQEIDLLHKAILPSKEILTSDFASLSRRLIDGNKYQIKIMPNLIQELRPQLEKENLCQIHKNGKLNLEKLLKFFLLVLPTFDQPLRELSDVVRVEHILSERNALEEAVETALENLNTKQETITSFSMFLKEQECQLTTFNTTNNNSEEHTLNKSFLFQRTTPTADTRSNRGSILNDSSCVNLMNLSEIKGLESPDSDVVFSPELRNRIINCSETIVAETEPLTTPVFSPEPLEKVKLDLPKPKFDKSRLKVGHFRKPLRKSLPNDRVAINNTKASVLRSSDKNNNSSMHTPTERRTYSFDAGSSSVYFEDLVLSPSLNNSYAASLMSSDSLNFSLLDAQTLPECPEFDLTMEVEASISLLELDD